MTVRWVLSHESRDIIQRFLRSQVLLAFDFDGTLAPIVEDPDRARMRAGTRRLLGQLAAAHPCIVVSGRSREDLRGKLVGTGIRRIIGNHGAEPWDGADSVRRQVAIWRESLAHDLSALPGVRIENKIVSVTVHYRQCRWKTRARSEILKTVRRLPGVRLIGGKQALNLVPKNAPNKGTALQEELARMGYTRAVYVGDDETDEDVFSLTQGVHLFTIRVGRRLSSQAGYFLRGQEEIDELLRILIAPGGGTFAGRT
ncbi:MAG: trehalose-phosphatase [Acidobacteriia bacterium]|nr:trehalose-phosphatase [Terriglobia bacterium]